MGNYCEFEREKSSPVVARPISRFKRQKIETEKEEQKTMSPIEEVASILENDSYSKAPLKYTKRYIHLQYVLDHLVPEKYLQIPKSLSIIGRFGATVYIWTIRGFINSSVVLDPDIIRHLVQNMRERKEAIWNIRALVEISSIQQQKVVIRHYLSSEDLKSLVNRRNNPLLEILSKAIH